MLTLTQIKYIIIGVVAIALLYFASSKIYDYGYFAAEKKYTEVIAQYNLRQEQKVELIEDKINQLLKVTPEYNAKLLTDMQNIKNGIEGKTLVVYKDGKCVITQEFLDARQAAILRANTR